jgi:hypothetical protein
VLSEVGPIASNNLSGAAAEFHVLLLGPPGCCEDSSEEAVAISTNL